MNLKLASTVKKTLKVKIRAIEVIIKLILTKDTNQTSSVFVSNFKQTQTLNANVYNNAKFLPV